MNGYPPEIYFPTVKSFRIMNNALCRERPPTTIFFKRFFQKRAIRFGFDVRQSVSAVTRKRRMMERSKLEQMIAAMLNWRNIYFLTQNKFTNLITYEKKVHLIFHNCLDFQTFKRYNSSTEFYFTAF